MEKSLEQLHHEHDYETIVKRFESYLGRYKEIFNPRSTTKKVLGLSKHCNDINRTLRYLTHNSSASEVHQMRNSIIDIFGEEELYQVIYLSFLITIDKFDVTRGVPLEKFIYNYYPYIFTAEINKLAGPRQVMNDPTLMSPLTDRDDDGAFTKGLDLSGIELDVEWIEGTTCNEPFTVLTSLERKILVMLFAENKTQEEVAQIMGYHFSSIKRKKNDILTKLIFRLNELEDD